MEETVGMDLQYYLVVALSFGDEGTFVYAAKVYDCSPRKLACDFLSLICERHSHVF